MKIAIIDDGVNCLYYPNIGKLCFDLKVNKNNKVVKRTRYDKKEASHGSACASIIKKYSKSAQIGSIKVISSNTFHGKVNDLVTALVWCEQNDIKFIHMSIGTCEIKDVEPIRKIINRLIDKEVIIVSALSNNMKFSVPACINGVFGVKTNVLLTNNEFKVLESGLYDVPFIASSKHILVDYFGKQHVTKQCNSYAAPLITALIHNYIITQKSYSLDNIRKFFGLKLTYEEMIKNVPLSSKDIDIPVVEINGEKDVVISVLYKLNNIFIKKRYPCKAFYCSNKRVDNKVEWIPSDISIKNFLSYHIDKLGLNIVLIAGNNIKINKITDVNINVSSDIKRNRFEGDHITMSENFTDNQLKNVVKYIEKLAQ